MKVVYIGCVQFSFHLLNHLISERQANIAGIITRQSSAFNADFMSLQPIAIEHGIPCYFDKGNNQTDMELWLKNLEPDVIYCFGWPYLLKNEILHVPRLGVVGYHPAALPKNRGRHPIIWAMALGLTETASTFFFMDEGADSGDILHQEFISIEKNEDVADIYSKLLVKAKHQVTTFTAQLIEGSYQRVPQEHSKANYWRKRTKEDGKIDWRMSAASIYNLVRALTKPYAGAHCIFNGAEIKIWKVKEVAVQDYSNHEPGKVLGSENGTIIVRCGDAAIQIIHHDFRVLPQVGEYL